MKEFIEGSQAVAKAVKMCKPQVISAYPITPQTHIVEGLSQMVADGELDTQFINVESEHSAASVVLGGVSAGSRVYTATSSQGLLLMMEVLYNIAGMRLPLVLTCANRAVSAPISIWNDHQDSVAARDTGWIQFYGENLQELVDLHIFAYRLSEDKRCYLPVMVCMDGYILTHGMEIVDFPESKDVDKFLPEYKPLYKLDVDNPLTLGPISAPSHYMETRAAIQRTFDEVLNEVIPELSSEFEKVFSRKLNPLIEEYKTDDAQIILVALGSVVGTIKDAVDELREQGKKVGVVKLVAHRPFPAKILCKALSKAKYVGVLEKAISLGGQSPVFTELKAAFLNIKEAPQVNGYVLGLGGRDISCDDIKNIVENIGKKQERVEFINIKENLITREPKW